MRRLRPAVAFLLLASMPQAASAACRMELATYADAGGTTELEFTPTRDAATVTNTFRLLLDRDVVLQGIVQWSSGAARPYGMLMHKCPEGDVTGAELDACTVWQGVIYAVDAAGAVTLLPAEGAQAPATLVLADLGPSLGHSAPHEAGVFADLPGDVFAMKGCQE